MKFTVNQKELLEAIQIVSKAVKRSVSVPLLETIKFDVQKGYASLTATNLGVEISTKVSVSGKDSETFCLNAAKIAKLISGLPVQELSFTVSDGKCSIKTSNGKYELPAENSEDFPVFSKETGTISFSVSGPDFADGLSRVKPAIVKDEIQRPNMYGVLLEGGEKLSFTASDSNRINHFEYPGNCDSFRVLLPKDSVASLPELSGVVSVEISDRGISLVSESVTVKSILSSEVFPNYQQIIPESSEFNMVVNRSELLASVGRVMDMANSHGKIVLDIDTGVLTLLAENIDLAESGTETVESSFEGEEMRIALNGVYLSESLRALSSVDVTFGFSAPNKIVMLTGDDSGYIAVMPMML